MVVGCLPGGDQLLGIGEPARADHGDARGTDDGDGRDVDIHGDADVVVRDEDGATPAAIRQSSRAA
jgi:hypothetical protein